MACITTMITMGYYPATDNNAYIVPIKNPTAIAEKVIEIINNREAASIRINNSYKDVKQFEWEIVSRNFIKVFQQNLR